MKFDDPDNTHWKFKNYLVYDFGKLAAADDAGKTNPAFDAVVKWGKITPEQARSYIAPGTGPTIVLGDKSDRQNQREFPYKLFVPPRLVDAFEKKDKSATHRTNKGKDVLKVEVFILEAIVVGSLAILSQDDKDASWSNTNKSVGGFEADAYGGIKGRTFVF